METTKIAANIKASVLRLAVISQWCERTSWCSRLQLHIASSDVFSITGRHRAIDLLCLMETWHDADSAVLGRLRGTAYTTLSIMRDCVQLTTYNHGGVAIVAGADIALSPVVIADHDHV